MSGNELSIPLSALWNRLQAVRSLRFVASSQSDTGWAGAGAGEVVARSANEHVVFEERGAWSPARGAELKFFNTYRWSRIDGQLRLEHLRYGVNHPVFLFDLAYQGDARWHETTPHQCADDRYSASLVLGEDSIVLAWSIQGPRKDESIEYVYQ